MNTQYTTELFQTIVTLKQKVGFILNKYPETRNSDKELVQRMADFFHLDPLTIYETVRRTRQQYNQHGLHLPTSLEIAKQRKINEEVWRAAFNGRLL